MPGSERLPDRARVVIVGAGIVGCSAAYHLTRLGWSDVVVVDQGPLFRAGGSTSHAAAILGISARMIQYKLHQYRAAPRSELEVVRKVN